MPESIGAAVAAFASSGAASTIGTALVTTAAGALASKALAPKAQAQTAPVAPVAPPKAQQATDPVDIAKKNAAAAAATGQLSGNSSTLLSGPQGVSPGSLNLGQSTLLGE